MKILKIIAYTIIGIVALAALVSIFLPSETEVERSITINAPVGVAFAPVNDLKQWPHWSPWNEMDPSMKVRYGDNTVGEGASYSWEGDPEVTGSGSLSITESRKNEYIKTNLDFGQQGTAIGYYDFEELPEGTKVTWGFHTEHGWNLMSRWIGAIFIAPMLGSTFDDGLNNLKEHVESQPVPSEDTKVMVTQVDPITYIGLETTIEASNPEAISATMAQLYGELMAYMETSGTKMTGPPLAIYNSFDPQTIEMVCGLPVADGYVINDEKITLGKTLGGDVVKAVHKGDYKQLPFTHDKVNTYINSNNLEVIGAPYEVYITDPGQVTDTSQWITEVYYPIGK